MVRTCDARENPGKQAETPESGTTRYGTGYPDASRDKPCADPSQNDGEADVARKREQ